MAEVVDSIIAELILKSQGYAEGFDQATAAHGRFRKSVDQLKGQTFDLQVEGRKYKAGSDAIASSEEQATQRITRTRKARADGATSAAATEKQAAKDAAAAVTAAEKEKQAAVSASERAVARAAAAQAKFQEQQSKRAQARYYASGPELFEAKAREFSAADAAEQAAAAQKVALADKEAAAAIAAAEKEKQAALAGTERAMARAQVASDRFVAAQTKAAEKRFYAMGPEIFEAKAREFAAAGAASEAQGRRPLNISSPVLTKAAGFENGQNPFQGAADAVGGISAAQSAEMRATTAAIAENEIKAAAAANDMTLAEAEANDRLILQLGLKARLIAADKAEAVAINDQLFALRQVSAYRARGLTELEAEQRVQAELLAIEIKRSRETEAQVSVRGSRRGGFGAANELAINATGGRFGYSLGPAAIAGVGILAGGSIIDSSVKYGQQLSDTSRQLGVSTRDLQVYQAMATKAGVTNEQLSSSFARLGQALGQAKDGDKTLKQIFSALDVDPKQFKSAGDALPELIDRLSKVQDPLQRVALGEKLFGTEYQKLDSILAGGNGNIEKFGKSMGDAILSDQQIQALKDTSIAIDEVKRQLLVDFSTTVANNKDAIIGLAGAIGTLTDKVLHFINAHPEIAFAAMGALAGSALGPAGAIAGGIGGYYAGGVARQSMADTNTSVQFREAQLKSAQDRLRAARQSNAGETTAGNSYLPFGLLTIRQEDKSGKPSTSIANAEAEVRRQTDLLDKARAAAAQRGKPPKITPGSPNQSEIDKALAGDGKKGKSTQALESEKIARDKRYVDELAQLQDQELRARNSIVTDIDKRAEGESKLADNALKRRLSDIEDERKANVNKGENPKEAEARAKTLSAAATEAANQERIARATQVKAQHVEADLEHTQAALSLSDEALNDQLAIARTTKDRLKADQAILANAKKLEQAQIDSVLNNPLSTPDQIADAKLRRDGDSSRGILSLDQRYDNRGDQILTKDASPFAAYANSLPRTADEIGEAFGKAAVSGVGRLNDSLADTLEKLTGIHGIAGQVLTDFIKIALQAAQAQALGDGGGAGVAQGIAATVGGNASSVGNGSGGFFGTLLSMAGRIFGLSGARAGGGPVNPNGTYLVGEKGPELLRMGPQGGSIVPNSALGAMNINTRAAAPQIAGPTINQNITYSGAVDIADRNYVLQVAAAQHAATQQAIAQSSQQTIAGTPTYIQQQNRLKG